LATNANLASPRQQLPATTTLPSRPKRCSTKDEPEPFPCTEGIEAEATRQTLESLQLRLDPLEERAHVKKRQQDHVVLPERFLASRPSMPVLMSQNTWQQHSIEPRPMKRRGPVNRRPTNIAGLDIDRSQLRCQEEGDALIRDTFFLR
jgi:hypothetical protein